MLLQLVSFVLILKNDLVGHQQRLCFSAFFPAGWYLVVCIWPLRHQPYAKAVAAGEANQYGDLRNGYKELRKVAFQLLQLPVLKRFLLSFFFVSMGVQTVMLAATLYGKSELQIETQKPDHCDFNYTADSDTWCICYCSFIKKDKQSFCFNDLYCCMDWHLYWCFLFATKKQYRILYTRNGGWLCYGWLIQSLCRSTYAKLMPETKDTASFFSFYDVTEKVAIVIGMFSFGIITELGTQRNAVLALMVFFILSLIFLLFTRWALKNKK